jgi:chromosomal replication initiation ATPase DnaA
MERLRDAIAVGSAAFSEKVRKVLRQSDREFAGRYQARKAATLPSVIKAVERHVGTPVVLGKRGGLGRDMALKLARDLCGLTLRELGAQMGGVDYASVHMAIRRLEQKMAKQSDLRKTMDRLKAGLLIV